MKVRLLWFGLVALLGLAGCAHQPVAQRGTVEQFPGATVQGQSVSAHPAANPFAPYQEVLADPGWF